MSTEPRPDGAPQEPTPQQPGAGYPGADPGAYPGTYPGAHPGAYPGARPGDGWPVPAPPASALPSGGHPVPPAGGHPGTGFPPAGYPANGGTPGFVTPGSANYAPGGIGAPQPFLPRNPSKAWLVWAGISAALSLLGLGTAYLIKTSWRARPGSYNGMTLTDTVIVPWAIVALVVPVLGLIVSWIAANLRTRAQGGAGWVGALSLLAIIAGGLSVVIVNSAAVRDDDGVISTAGEDSVMEMTVGDCFAIPDGESVSTLLFLPCDQPHDAEVFAIRQATSSTFAEFTDSAESDSGCLEEFDLLDFNGVSPEDLDFQAFTPTIRGWKAGDHEYVCWLAPYYADEVLVGSTQAGTLELQPQQ